MIDPARPTSPASLLVYDGECRLCVTVKNKLESMETHSDAILISMIPYQSEEARRALRNGYRDNPPDVIFLVQANGEIIRGLDVFLVFLSGVKGGRFISGFLKLTLIRHCGYLVYWFIARYRYRIFGKVPLAPVVHTEDR